MIRVRAALMVYCDHCAYEHIFPGEVPSINISTIQAVHRCPDYEGGQGQGVPDGA